MLNVAVRTPDHGDSRGKAGRFLWHHPSHSESIQEDIREITRRSKQVPRACRGLVDHRRSCGDDDGDATERDTTAERPRHREDPDGTSKTPTRHRTADTAAEGTHGEAPTARSTGRRRRDDHHVRSRPGRGLGGRHPITAADFECTWQAHLNTPGSLVDGRLRQDRQRRSRRERQAGRHQVRTRLRAVQDASSTRSSRRPRVEDCSDVSTDFETDASDIGQAVQDQLVEHEQLDLRPEPELLGRCAGHRARRHDRRSPTSETEIAASRPAKSTSSSRRPTPASTMSSPTRTWSTLRLRRLLRGAVLPAGRRRGRRWSVRRRRLPRGVLEVDRREAAVQPDLRAVRQGRRC